MQRSQKHDHVVKHFTRAWLSFIPLCCPGCLHYLHHQGSGATSSVRHQQLPVAVGRKCFNRLKKRVLVPEHAGRTGSCFVKPSEATEAFKFGFYRAERENERQHS